MPPDALQMLPEASQMFPYASRCFQMSPDSSIESEGAPGLNIGGIRARDAIVSTILQSNASSHSMRRCGSSVPSEGFRLLGFRQTRPAAMVRYIIFIKCANGERYRDVDNACQCSGSSTFSWAQARARCRSILLEHPDARVNLIVICI